MLLELLYRFQEMEIRERELQQTMKALPQFKELKKIKERFAHNQKKLEATKTTYGEVSRRLKKTEDQANVLEEKQTELNRLLYAGTINNAKELESIDQQIKTLGEQLSEISDEILKMMVEKDSFEEELGKIEHGLKVEYQEFNKLKLHYNRVKLNLEQEMAALEEDKRLVLSQLDEKTLSWYRDSKDKFGGSPVAKVMENHACSGCRTLIPITIVKETRLNLSSVFCEHCGRMLYAPEVE
ncbi:MAG: C4-type zinc ribbon domain-containing protein [Dehalobacterium sp.]